MNILRGLITGAFLFFGFYHLLSSGNAASNGNHAITWAGGVIGIIELTLAYAIWLIEI